MAAFPDEILVDIFEYLQPSEDEQPGHFPQHTPTLRSLCLVSTQFRRVAEPLLYHTVFLNTPILERWGENAEHTQPTILHTLLRNPTLGRHIRGLRSQACPIRTDRVTEQFQRQEIRLGINANYTSNVSKWLEVLCPYDPESFDFEGWPCLIILVLALAPNVDSLALTLADPSSSYSALFEFMAICGRCFLRNKLTMEDRSQDTVLKGALKPTSTVDGSKTSAPLLMLDSLHFVGDAPGYNTDFSLAVNLGLLRLPQLRHFRTTRLDWEGLDLFGHETGLLEINNIFTSRPDRLASMQMLHIWDSRTHNPEDLRLILQHCNKLEAFVLRLDNMHSVVDYAAYGQVLAQHGQGLRQLEIYAEPTAHDSWEGRDIPTIGSLRVQMPNLVQLRIFLARLIGTEGGRAVMADPPDIASQLPEGLRYLYLTIGHPLHYKEVILDFLETAPERMPALEWVVIQDAHSHVIPFRSTHFRVVKNNKARRLRAFGKVIGPGEDDLGKMPWESAFRN